MTEIITYSLRTGRERSDSYYHEAAAFTDQVQREALTRHRFEVRIITHSSAAFAEGELDGLSIVGIGCVSTLLSGGWKARSLGLPAQCVLLDYCGCKAHWHPTGIATAINLRQLQRVLHL